MSEFYRVRCRNGKTEIEIESSDREYVDRKLDELLRSFPPSGKKKHAPAPTVKAAPAPAQAKPEPLKVDAPKAAKPVAAPSKPQPQPKAAKPVVKPAQMKQAAEKVEPPKAIKPQPGNGVSVESFADQIRGHKRFAQIKKNILRQPSQLPRVLLCHYFADQLGPGLGLTANQVEAITEQLGVRIAAPNVAKVIRQQAKKLFSSERQDGVTRHRINRAGVTAAERLIAGKAL